MFDLFILYIMYIMNENTRSTIFIYLLLSLLLLQYNTYNSKEGISYVLGDYPASINVFYRNRFHTHLQIVRNLTPSMIEA